MKAILAGLLSAAIVLAILPLCWLAGIQPPEKLPMMVGIAVAVSVVLSLKPPVKETGASPRP